MEIGAEQHGLDVGAEEFTLASDLWGDASTLHVRESKALALSFFCWRLLLEVARARRGRDIALGGRRMVDQAAMWLKAEGLAFEASVDGVERFLGALKELIHLAAATTWLDQVLAEERSAPTVVSSLPVPAWREQLRARGAPEKRCRSSGGGVVQSGHRGVFLQNQVARSLGIGCGSMAILVKAAGIVVEEDRRDQRAYRLIAPIEAQKLEAFRAAYVNRMELPRALGVKGRHVVRHLLNSGHLRRALLEAGLYYMRHDLNALLEDLSRRALPWDPSLQLVGLAEERLWRYTTARADRQLLADLRNGNEPLYHHGRGVGLQQFGVPTEVAAKHHARSRVSLVRRAEGFKC
jgi:hypothetical protein